MPPGILSAQGERLFSDGSFWPDFTNEMGEFFKPIGSEAMDIHVQGLPSISNHFISEMAGQKQSSENSRPPAPKESRASCPANSKKKGRRRQALPAIKNHCILRGFVLN